MAARERMSMLPCRSQADDLAETCDEGQLALGNPFGHCPHDPPRPLAIERAARRDLDSLRLEVIAKSREMRAGRSPRRGAQIGRFQAPNGCDRSVERGKKAGAVRRHHRWSS